MSEQTAAGDVPEWDLADRMRKALRHADVGVQEMANYLDVDRSTVSTWINGRITPSVQTLRLWSLRCGLSYTWLLTGDAEATVECMADAVRKRGLLDLIILTRLAA